MTVIFFFLLDETKLQFCRDGYMEAMGVVSSFNHVGNKVKREFHSKLKKPTFILLSSLTGISLERSPIKLFL